MRFAPYKKINKIIEEQTFEPTLSWGLRMGIAAMVPLIWGISTNNLAAASWITLTAECICWVELKGSFGQRFRVLTGGILLALIFTLLGTITANNLLFSILVMLGVGFLSGLFKNLGDRGSGLAICVYVLFIMSNALPADSVADLKERLILTTIGGFWNMVVGLAATLIIPAQEPYRRTIALIWKANAGLVKSISRGWDGKSLRSNIRKIYEEEKAVRQAIDSSLHFYEAMAHQVSRQDNEEYQLAQLRKATSLVAAHTVAISDELESVRVNEVPPELRLRLFAFLRALEDTLERMAVYVILVKPEEELLLSSRMAKLGKSILLLKEYPLTANNHVSTGVKRVIQLAERILRLIDASVNRLERFQNELPIYRSYSLLKTLFVLHPKHLLRNLKLLFDLNTFTFRYAFRIAIGATIALGIYKWFRIDHGFWLPFTVMIVAQPYFGATFRKALDRVIGTVAGGLVGGVLIQLPAHLYLKELMLFACFICMVYFIRKQYALAAFFITVSLVLLFDVEETINPTLILIRALSTIGGACIAILIGFALLPSWDRKWLPIHISSAVACNYQYFLRTFFSDTHHSWTRNKRSAESKNSNAFDSFTRYMQEPAIGRKVYIPFYQLITHNVRITRELNNINLEEDNKETEAANPLPAADLQKIYDCLAWFNRNIEALKTLNPGEGTAVQLAEHLKPAVSAMTLSQHLYLDKLLIELKSMHQDLSDLKGNNDHGLISS